MTSFIKSFQNFKLIFLETTTLICLAGIFLWFIYYVIKLCCSNDKYEEFKSIWKQTQQTVGRHTTELLARDEKGIGERCWHRGTKASWVFCFLFLFFHGENKSLLNLERWLSGGFLKRTFTAFLHIFIIFHHQYTIIGLTTSLLLNICCSVKIKAENKHLHFACSSFEFLLTMYFQKWDHYWFKDYEHFYERWFFKRKIFLHSHQQCIIVPVSRGLASIGCHMSTFSGQM